MKKLLSILFITAMVPTLAFATANLDNLFDDNSLFGDTSSNETTDDLFGGDDLFSSASSSDTTEASLFEDLLTSETEITGSYYFNFNTGLNYDLDTQDTLTFYASSDVSANIELNARPSTETRFYTDVTITYPFENEGDDATTPLNEEYNYINVDELFYDFVIDDYFVRVGKQTLNMGVGYFYSPSNLLNITSINPLNPEASQEGPLAIKVNKPIKNDNLYAYLTMPAESKYELEDVSIAATYETLIGDTEYTLSGYYNYDIANDPAKFALTISSPIFTDIDLIAETVESYDGSSFTFEGTVGISIMKDIESLTDTSISLVGQYYYDQDGESIIFDTTHQLGAMLSVNTAYDLSLAISSINFLSESAGVLTGNICYDVSDDFSIDFGTTYTYGAQNTIQPYIGFTLGQGDF